MAFGALITSIALWAKLKPTLGRAEELPSVREISQRHWNYGRWALASAGASWAMSATFYFALSSFHGLAASGEMKALLNLSAPAAQGFTAVSLLSLPYASRIYDTQTPAEIRKLSHRLTALYAGGTAVYFALVIGLGPSLLHLLYKGKYMGVTRLIPWLGLAMVLRIGATAQALLLRAIQSPSQVFIAYGASTLVAVLAGIPATKFFGLQGAIVTTVAVGATALLVSGVLLRNRLRAIELRGELHCGMTFTLKQFNIARENVAAALDISPRHIEVHRYEWSPEKRSTRVWGNALGKSFFAKTLMTDPYQVTPRISVPWDDAGANTPILRPIAEQIEVEWNTTHQLRRLLNVATLPEPIGRSVSSKTIVWGDVHGVSFNEFVKRPRLWGSGSPFFSKGVSAAGAWLRSLHERSLTGRSVIVDLGEMRQGLQARMRQNGLMSFPYAKRALQALESAISEIGRTVFEAPAVLSHGDFMMTNLLWNAHSGDCS